MAIPENKLKKQSKSLEVNNNYDRARNNFRFVAHQETEVISDAILRH